MTLDQVAGKWKLLARSFREQFGRFTNDDVSQLDGSAEQLLAKLQEKYGESRQEAERRLHEWSDNLRDPDYRARGSAAGGSRQA